MGSVYAGLLASTAHDLLLIGRPGAHIEAIRTHGLRVDGASGDRRVQPRALDAPPNEIVDLLILAVKATQVDRAAAEARGMMGAHTRVVTIQNGFGSGEIVARHLGGERLVIGVAAAFGASITAPGHAHHKGMEAIKLGAYAGLSSNDVDAVAEVWRAAGFNAVGVPDILATQWEKLICNASFSAVCALTGLTVGAAMASRHIGRLCIDAGVEAWEVGRRACPGITVADPAAHIRAFAERVAGAKPSLLQDIEARRPSEIDFINGAIPREAERIGHTAPVNSALAALVRDKEARIARA